MKIDMPVLSVKSLHSSKATVENDILHYIHIYMRARMSEYNNVNKSG
jgi:hypothetical protein